MFCDGVQALKRAPLDCGATVQESAFAPVHHQQIKMKRSKVDIINATVESYLKRRRYQASLDPSFTALEHNLQSECLPTFQDSEVFRRSERVGCRTSEEMTLRASAECSTSRDNSIAFSAIINDVDAADQAYHKLKHWIVSVADEKLKNELKGLLYPVFCHLYIEMLHAGNRQAAAQFLKTHQTEFSADVERNFLDELSGVMTFQDIELKPLINAFRTRKYKVDMSDEAHICLQKYLAKFGHVILMQVINTHITIIKKINDSYSDNDETNEDAWQNNDIMINGHIEQPCGTGVDREMRELQEAIRLIRNNSHQPLRIFTVNNAIENASSAIMSPAMDKMAVGFNTAEIRLWAIGDTVLTKPNYRTPSVTLAYNSLDDCSTESRVDDFDEAGAIVLRGHTDVVHDMRFITESNVLLSVSSDKDMRVWRINDYSCAAIYNGHNYPIWCMDTSVFDLYIATGSHDRTAKLWSLDRTFPLRIFAGHFLDINCIRFHPNARYLATGSSDKTVRLWSKDDGSLVRVYVGAQSPIYGLAFSPDGKYLASAGDDKCVTIWDLSTNAKLTDLKGHQESVMNLDWSLDGQYLASSSIDGIVRLWSTQEHINASNNSNLNNSVTENTQSFTTNCSSILSLRYYPKSNSPICIGTI